MKKLIKPTLLTDETTGRRFCRGSLSELSRGSVEPATRKGVLRTLAQSPAFQSSISKAVGVSEFNVSSQQGLSLFLADLAAKGEIEFDKRGWHLTELGRQAIESMKEDE